jgi:hypothetical protein
MTKKYNPINQFDKASILENAFKDYLNWWTPIDIDSGSTMAPMSFERFCETLLIFDNIWYNKWLDNKILNNNHTQFKTYILSRIIKHNTKL